MSSRWKRIVRHRWEHRCPEQGTVIVTREMMGIFWMSKLQGECPGKEPGPGYWALDKEWSGCPLCGDFPPELDGLLDHIRNGAPEPDLFK